MDNVKRGRLRRATVEPMYDEKGKITGHKVMAEHENDSKGKEYHYVPPIESPHETVASAMDKVKQHVDSNCADCGMAAKPKAKMSMREQVGIA